MNLWHLGAEDKESVVSLLLFMTPQSKEDLHTWKIKQGESKRTLN